MVSNVPLDPRAVLASSNNVDWYAEECEAWGITYQRSERIWLSYEHMPPYHSNLLWESEDDPNPTLSALQSELTSPWSIKDAHARHDFSDSGFELLFAAKWYWLDAQAGATIRSDDKELFVTTVVSAASFERWIYAWGETPPAQPVFHPALWQRSNVSFICAESANSEVLGGLAANRSTNCIGITNCFGSTEAIAMCIRSLCKSGLPIVGYDRQQDLSHLTDLGFEITGDLNIWISSER